MSVSLSWSYFNNAFSQIARDEFLDLARRAKERAEFDTVVVSGVSGVVMGAFVAHALDVDLLIVRKEDDRSTHSYDRVEGSLGRRWVFLDDFTETGKTRKRVRSVVTDAAANYGVETSFVGSLLYQAMTFANGNNKTVLGH